MVVYVLVQTSVTANPVLVENIVKTVRILMNYSLDGVSS